jgi:uncharacterized membrane protein (UPF0136 family)
LITALVTFSFGGELPLAPAVAVAEQSGVNFIGRWFVGFGVFLILCGVAGYLSNPAGAKTALMSGGMFGGLSALWGVLMLKGFAWARIAAWVSTLVLVAAFAWRSIAGWMAYAGGEPKLFVASLITLMLAASLASLAVLAKRAT